MDKQYKNASDQEQVIDLVEIAKKLWVNWKFIFKVCSMGLLVGLIVAFSLPKEYTTRVVLAPEGGSNNLSGLGAFAAMSGINIGNMNSKDILLKPELFPSIIESTPFLLGLFEINVRDDNQKIDTAFYSYLKDYERKAWWSYVWKAPFQLLKMIRKNDISDRAVSYNKIVMTPEQKEVIKNISNRISVDIDVKTGIATLSITMQSPEISTFIADTVTYYLQEYIIQFRTEKARKDLLFTEKLFDEAKMNYYTAQRNYATFVDENLGIISTRFKMNQERLQNEMSLAYAVYNQTAQQLQLAKVKVQDATPVYTVIQPAVVPLKPSKPKKIFILFGFVLLSAVASSAWIIAKNFLFDSKN